MGTTTAGKSLGSYSKVQLGPTMNKLDRGSPTLRQRIDGWISPEEFIAALGRAKLHLGNTKLFGSSHKIDLSNDRDTADLYATMVLYMPPSDSSGRWNFCVWATPGCRAVCLGIGSGRMNQGQERLADREFDWNLSVVAQAQLKRAELFMEDRRAFLAQMVYEVHLHVERAKRFKNIKHNRKWAKPAVRPNGATDLPWEKIFPELFTMFGEVTFYDYTKAPRSVRPTLPTNYHITFSLGETVKNQTNAAEWMKAGVNVAVVFGTSKDNLPTTHKGLPVLNGDLHDERFKDAPGHYVGLSAKGAAKHDKTGFVVRDFAKV